MEPQHIDLGLDRYLAPFEARRLAFYRFDVVVLGSGVAGATAALAAAREQSSVALVAKDVLEETNTRYAQGGVAVVLDPADSFEAHVADTLNVGLGLSDPAVVEAIVRAGPEAIEQLVSHGASFDRRVDGRLDLSREGGHSQPRIVHAEGAATGIEIQRTLARAVTQTKDIAVFERTFAIDLLSAPDGRVIGVLCQTARGELVAFSAGQVILATGGGGQIYRETTNPSIATGDGVAMAFRAGAVLRDLEFFQFHPTCLYIAGAARVLVSEIVRGAGGILLDKDGVRFMPEYHPDAELAPRDVVSRACFDRMVSTGDTNVYLDLSDLERDPHQLFPGISRICHHFSIDIARDPIPVRPGAHYMIGGVLTDVSGRSSVPGLWAVGESASSGLHGANRMGSNSLLEGMVVGRQAGLAAAAEAREVPLIPLERDLCCERRDRSNDVRVGIQDMTYSLKSLMWRQLGIVRRGPTTRDAIERISFWTRAVLRLATPEPHAWELINMLTLSRLLAHAALFREESRGTHYREDFPRTSPDWLAHTLLQPERQQRGPLGVALTREPVLWAAALR
jgi:L-aspartate oxidase